MGRSARPILQNVKCLGMKNQLHIYQNDLGEYLLPIVSSLERF